MSKEIDDVLTPQEWVALAGVLKNPKPVPEWLKDSLVHNKEIISIPCWVVRDDSGFFLNKEQGTMDEKLNIISHCFREKISAQYHLNAYEYNKGWKLHLEEAIFSGRFNTNVDGKP